MSDSNNNAAFIWSIANLLRGVYKQADYGKVILPFTILRRLDAVLEPTKYAVLAEYTKRQGQPGLEHILPAVSGHAFYNISLYTLKKLAGDPANLRANLVDYVQGFSTNVRDIFERYNFNGQLETLEENDLLLLVLQQFAAVDLHPDRVSNNDMGMIFEELIRRFAESSNETAGEHFTPREVVRLIVSLLFTEHEGEDPARSLTVPGAVRTVYDPTAGTGGMLSVSDDYVREHFPQASLTLMGQELNAESFAIAKADMIIKGQNVENMVWGDTLTNDGHTGKTFDFGLANPPFGVEWKKQQAFVNKEYADHGFDGRFGPGLPRVSDGSLLFLLHLVKKMRPKKDGGGRVGIVSNGSPLFTGSAGSGESNIRRYLIENDLVDAIIGLPTDIFYNTGIATYIWILDNDKPASRRGTIQLVDATGQWVKMRKSLGSKRREISPEQIKKIVRLYGEHEASEASKILRNEDFGYTTITVERPLQLNWALTPERVELAVAAKALAALSPADADALASVLKAAASDEVAMDLAAFTKRVETIVVDGGLALAAPQIKALLDGLSERDETAPIVRDSKGKPVPDADLRDTENVPLRVSVEDYVAREIAPHVANFWIDRSKDKVGYEIPFTRHFYKYSRPRSLDAIDADVNRLMTETLVLMEDVERAGTKPSTATAESGLMPGWTAMRIAHATNGIKDGTHGSFERVEDGVPLLSAKNVQNDRLRLQSDESLISPSDALSVVANGYPRKNDILLSIVGTIGRVATYDLEYALPFQRSVCFLRPRAGTHPQFLKFALQGGQFQDQLLLRAKVAAQSGVYLGDVADCQVLMPNSLEHQREIADYLDRETTKIDDLIARQERLVGLLRERRQALVNAAVTGEIDVKVP
jgi:type I restriction enzyme M protein